MLYPLIVYTVFALLATVGLYLIGNHFHSRALGIKLAVGSAVFFIGLIVALTWVIQYYEG